jgi:hypothetical protein
MKRGRSSPEAEQLTAQLEAAALRALGAQYDDANGTFFDGLLRRPTLRLGEAEGRLGAWVSAGRTLEIARHLLLRPWGIVVEVLKHEMAHQYVDEVLRVDETAHGARFRAVCEERGIDAQATGIPEAGAAASPVIERITKLLALAESPNEHEAQAAMRAARRLMLKHNLDEVTRTAAGGYGFRHLGTPTGRVNEAQTVLSNMLSDYFFVDAIWVPVWRPLEAKRGSVLEICGTKENLDLAEYVHGFLLTTSERLWRDHKRRERIPHNRDRRAYLAGVMTGFREQLHRQAKSDEREGLIWLGDPELDRYFRRRFPRVRWSRHQSTRGSAAHQHGRAAGERIVLHRGVSAGPSGGPKLLTR